MVLFYLFLHGNKNYIYLLKIYMKNYILCVIATNDPHRMKDISQFIPWGEEIFPACLSENQPKIHLVTLNVLNDHIKWTRRKNLNQFIIFYLKI